MQCRASEYDQASVHDVHNLASLAVIYLAETRHECMYLAAGGAPVEEGHCRAQALPACVDLCGGRGDLRTMSSAQTACLMTARTILGCRGNQRYIRHRSSMNNELYTGVLVLTKLHGQSMVDRHFDRNDRNRYDRLLIRNEYLLVLHRSGMHFAEACGQAGASHPAGFPGSLHKDAIPSQLSVGLVVFCRP